MKQTKFWLKLIGVAFLLHIVLIILSVMEVTVFSYLISPGESEKYYEAHAEDSGPWISAIFGSLIIFMLIKRFIRKNNDRYLTYAVFLPVVYIAIDVLLLQLFNISWEEHLAVFAVANGAKILASLFSYYIFRSRSLIHDHNLQSDVHRKGM
jgi:ABC-type uncharacterized transport system permease subunit